MIEAKGLMAGNYVTYHGDVDMVCKLDEQDILNISTNYMGNAEIHSPIPLTPEVLEDCGFRKSGGEFSLTTEYHTHYVVIEDDGEIYMTVASSHSYTKWKDVKYLHEIQNLYYCLTGTELTYKNK